MAKKTNKISQAELARLAHCSPQVVYKAKQSGKLAVDKRGRIIFTDPVTQLWLNQKLVDGGHPYSPAVVQSEPEGGNEGVAPGGAKGKSASLAVNKPLVQIKIEEEIRRIKSDTMLKELRYAVQRGELIEKKRLGDVLFKYLDALNSALLDIPDMTIDMLTDMIMAGRDRGAVVQYLRDAIGAEIRNTKKQIKGKIKV